MQDDSTILHRKKALPMSEVVQMYIRSMKLASGLNTRLIFEAWDKASNAAQFTIKRYFRDGKLYITLNSSMVRGQLNFQKDLLVERMNKILMEDELFVKDDPNVKFVEQLILK